MPDKTLPTFNPRTVGVHTSEFYVVVIVALSIVILSAFGKISASSDISLAAMAVVYNVLRSSLKSKAMQQ